MDVFTQTTVCFGAIHTYVFLGGGTLLSEYAPQLQAQGYRVRVVTSRRHLDEVVAAPDRTLAQQLAVHRLEPLVYDDVGDGREILGEGTQGMLGLSFGAAWIFRKPFIDRCAGRLLNIHGARFPLDRGGGGFSWQILRGNRLGGSVIHQIDEGIDSGPILKSCEFTYPSSCRIPREYNEVCIQQTRVLLQEFFEEVRREQPFTLRPQQHRLATYWPRLSTEHHGYIDWRWSLREIERFICAFDEPYQGASTFLRGKRVFLKDCLINVNDGPFHPFQQGLIYRIADDGVFVATEGGGLVIRTMQDARGADVKPRIRVGDRFSTPIEVLEQTRQVRAVYTATALKT